MGNKNYFILFLLFASSAVYSAPGNDFDTRDKHQEKKNVFLFFGPRNSNSSVSIYQDERVEQIFLHRQDFDFFERIPGFRVQVFSSNLQKKAKDEAYNVEREILEKFPDEKVYVTYTSPFWKVRVGNFRKKEDAEELQKKLKRNFPHFRNEIYIVQDEVVAAQ